MQRTAEAIFEDGVLKPLEPLDLAEHQVVQLTIEVAEASEPIASLAAWRAVYEGLDDAEVAAVERIALDRSNFMAPPT
jgi:predicted DNA-binding antitoxin AbrB/MazE fold protein